MDRNTNTFAFTPPDVDISRSRFNLSHRHLTTFNTGELIPLTKPIEVLPGDTFSVDMSSLVRMTTSIFPTMDNCYLDVYWYFVPNRLVWDHWKEFNGENNSTYWTQTTEYNVPMIKAGSTVASIVHEGSIADYFGIPTSIMSSGEGYEFSALPFRGYVEIWNNWFRDQNVMQPAYCPKDDTDRIFVDQFNFQGINYAEAHLGTTPLPVCKYHDYFTSCLPAPQKGEAVKLPLYEDNIPVFTGEPHDLSSYGTDYLNFVTSDQEQPANGDVGLYNGHLYSSNDSISTIGSALVPNNLYADVSNVSVATVNQLRTAFQIQRLFEKDARGGTRYREILKAHFGVTSPDARLQVPEYLGGKRIPINMDQVLQTSGPNYNGTPLGTAAGFSLTSDVSSSFTKSFVEHGYLFCLGAVRTDHTYQQGLDRHWSRKRRFDFYWPTLANIGEQAVLKKEILCTGTPSDEEAFGYQEAWAEYRYIPSYVSGIFRSGAYGTLDSWHYADYYTSDDIVLNSEWMSETKANVERTLAVTDEPQFLADFYFKIDAYRPLPLYSVPGLIDHN